MGLPEYQGPGLSAFLVEGLGNGQASRIVASADLGVGGSASMVLPVGVHLDLRAVWIPGAPRIPSLHEFVAPCLWEEEDEEAIVELPRLVDAKLVDQRE